MTQATIAKERTAEALRHWQAQEDAPFPEGPADAGIDDRQLPSGWWLGPVLVLSAAFWAALIAVVAF